MTKKSDAPAIRFKGFSDAWEQRKLASLCEKFTDGDWIESKDQSDFGVRLVQTGNVGVAEYLDKTNNKKWISEDTFDRLHCEEVLPGDILISRLPEPAGRACIVPLLGTKMITAVDCTIVRTAPDMSNKFLVQYLSSQAYFDDVNTCLAGGTRQRISRGNLANFNVPIPVKKSEQDAIGMFFGYLDNLITLHQRQPFLQSPPDISLIVQLTPPFYTFSWEQRKLGDMMNVTSVKRIHQSDWTDSGVRFLRARDIVAAAKNEEPDDYLYISKEKYEEYSALSGKVGVSDLLVTGVGTIGVPYLVRNLEPLYFKDGNIIWFQNLDKIDGKFLFYSFSAEQIQGFINESAGIGTVGTYTIESGKKTPISLPNQIEQAKVGEFFQQLDNLITLHQRQPFLHSPPDISLIVQLTPPFYTFSWEQRKLGELALFNPKDELPQTFEYVDLESVVGTEMLSHRTEVKSSAPSRAQRLAHTGDLFYQTVRPYQKNNYLFEKPDNNYVFSTGYAQMRPYVDGYFLLSLVQSERFVKVVLDNCTGTSYPAINANDLAEIEVAAPSDESEAQKIGTIFRSIDNLITLHQRELEKLQNIKKSMLEKMFV